MQFSGIATEKKEWNFAHPATTWAAWLSCKIKKEVMLLHPVYQQKEEEECKHKHKISLRIIFLIIVENYIYDDSKWLCNDCECPVNIIIYIL